MPRTLLILLVVAGVMLVGVMSGFLSSFAQTRLDPRQTGPVMVPTATSVMPSPTPTSQVVVPTATPTATPTPVTPSPPPTRQATSPRAAPSPVRPPASPTVIHDSFARPDQPCWGRTTDGHAWEGDASMCDVFQIQGSTGQIVAGSSGAYTALVGPAAPHERVLATMTITDFGAQQNNMGVVLRFSDSTHFYKALFDGAQFRLIKVIEGTTTELAAMPFAATAQTLYVIQFEAVGAQLSASIWALGTPRPPTPELVVTNKTPTT